MVRINAFVIATALLMSANSAAQAGFIINGDLDAGTGQLVITSDIEFTMLSPTSNIRGIVFDEWALFDGSYSQYFISPHMDIITDGTARTANAVIVEGGTVQNDVTINDGRIQTTSLAASSTYILESGVYSLGQTLGGWNPNLQGGFEFTGNVFLTDSGLNRVSNIVSASGSGSGSASVPEPSSLILMAVGSGILLVSRWRRRRISAQDVDAGRWVD